MIVLYALMFRSIQGALAACPATPEDVSHTIDQALGNWAAVHGEAFLADAEAARRDVACLSAPLIPNDVARLHLVSGLVAWRSRDEPRVIAAMRAVRAIEPAFELPTELAPQGGALRSLFVEACALPPSAETAVQRPGVNVDGVPDATALPTERATLIFWVDDFGVTQTRTLDGVEDVAPLLAILRPAPPESPPVASNRRESPPHARRGLSPEPASLGVAEDTATQPVAPVRYVSAAKMPYRVAWTGPRVSVGIAYTMAGDPSATDTADGAQAVGFAGPGARAGLGLDVGLTSHVGALAEVGYHGLYAPGAGVDLAPDAATGTQHVAITAGDTLHMGYGWLAASLRFSNLWLAAGPVLAVGSATVNGVTGACVATETAGCPDTYPSLTAASAAGQRVTGRITASGGAASVSYGVVDVASLRGAISLEGGAQSDSYRLYVWSELAFTLAPSAQRR